MNLRIIEVYDGRLPEYRVVDQTDKIVKTFDTFEEAEQFINNEKVS